MLDCISGFRASINHFHVGHSLIWWRRWRTGLGALARRCTWNGFSQERWAIGSFDELNINIFCPVINLSIFIYPSHFSFKLLTNIIMKRNFRSCFHGTFEWILRFNCSQWTLGIKSIKILKKIRDASSLWDNKGGNTQGMCFWGKK